MTGARRSPVLFFAKGAHLVFASFYAGVCVRLARGMLVHARESFPVRVLTDTLKRSKDEIVRTTSHVKGRAPARACHYNPRGYSEPRRRWKWQTLVHRATDARRVTGGLFVSHASRFSIGCRFAALGSTHDKPLWSTWAGMMHTSGLHGAVSPLTSRP